MSRNDLDTTEAATIADLAAEAVDPSELEVGTVYAVADGSGTVRIADTDQYAEHPRRATGTRTVLDAASFVTYLNRHWGASTEVYADPVAARVVGVLDSHEASGESTGIAGAPGWQQHKVTLVLTKSPSWQAWERYDGKLLPQLEFAEFIELQANDVRTPSAAELLELAQQFTAKRSVDFESSDRLQSGQVRLAYKETIQARAGQKGNIDIPTSIVLALKPYIGGPTYAVTARFRYRLVDTNLVLGYVLERPQVILESAFNDVVTEIISGRAQTDTVLGHAGIAGDVPVFIGKP